MVWGQFRHFFDFAFWLLDLDFEVHFLLDLHGEGGVHHCRFLPIFELLSNFLVDLHLKDMDILQILVLIEVVKSLAFCELCGCW